jgi:adenosylmethionine-8-amino-7-oxononanoate aminotransferase
MAFSKGSPKWGLHLAEELEKLVAFHDPSTIAAVILEPCAGSTGNLLCCFFFLYHVICLCSDVVHPCRCSHST